MDRLESYQTRLNILLGQIESATESHNGLLDSSTWLPLRDAPILEAGNVKRDLDQSRADFAATINLNEVLLATNHSDLMLFGGVSSNTWTGLVLVWAEFVSQRLGRFADALDDAYQTMKHAEPVLFRSFEVFIPSCKEYDSIVAFDNELDVFSDSSLGRIVRSTRPIEFTPLDKWQLHCFRELAEVVKREPGTNPEPYDPALFERDKWLYENISRNSCPELVTKLKKIAHSKNWYLIETANGIKKRVDKYRTHFGLEKRRFRNPGSEKTSNS